MAKPASSRRLVEYDGKQPGRRIDHENLNLRFYLNSKLDFVSSNFIFVLKLLNKLSGADNKIIPEVCTFYLIDLKLEKPHKTRKYTKIPSILNQAILEEMRV